MVMKMHKWGGRFTIIDGLDGIGKGVIIDVISKFEKGGVFDLTKYWKEHGKHPPFDELRGFKTLISCEPTYEGVGKKIREEIITKGSKYSALETANAYSENRLKLYNEIVLPFVNLGGNVIQSRSVCSSLVYQKVQGNGELDWDKIMELEGNKFALLNAPNLLIIPTIKNPREVMKRLAGREKEDNCMFENLQFQLKLKPIYESSELREIFESRGTTVRYLDAGRSIEYTKKMALEIYREYYGL